MVLTFTYIEFFHLYSYHLAQVTTISSLEDYNTIAFLYSYFYPILLKKKQLEIFLFKNNLFIEIHCCSLAKSCLTLCNPMDCSTPGFPVLHYLPEFAQIHVCWVSDAIQSSHSLSPPSPALNNSQHQGLFQWISSLHQVTKVLELQRQFYQWIFRVDFL